MGDVDTWYIMGYGTCEMGHDGWFMWDETWCMIHGRWGMLDNT